jgi:hypothetical protein
VAKQVVSRVRTISNARGTTVATELQPGIEYTTETVFEVPASLLAGRFQVVARRRDAAVDEEVVMNVERSTAP